MNNFYGQLPDTLFKVYVPRIATYTKEELDNVGLYMNCSQVSIGNDSYSKRFSHNIRKSKPKHGDESYDIVMVMLDIDKIINIYRQGHPVTLVDGKEVIEVYNIINSYLYGVNHQEEFSMNSINRTENRLVELNNFANEIYNLNKAEIVVGEFVDDEENPLDMFNSGENDNSIMKIDNGNNLNNDLSNIDLDNFERNDWLPE